MKKTYSAPTAIAMQFSTEGMLATSNPALKAVENAEGETTNGSDALATGKEFGFSWNEE